MLATLGPTGDGDAPTVPLDQVCARAVKVARQAAVEVAGMQSVGPHQGVEAEDEHVVTHYFTCRDRGYVGWRWAVTVVRAPDSDRVTVNEVVLLPGPDALLAPPWVPWTERLRAGDVGVGDIAPTPADDPRLDPAEVSVPDPRLPTDDETADALVAELWLGRPRVLSRRGRDDAAERWYAGDRGPNAPIARAARLSCGTCGFLVPLAGSLGRLFGVCANAVAPDDGRVVSFDHGCGAHSEALVVQTRPRPFGDRVPTAADEGADAPEARPEDSAAPAHASSAPTPDGEETQSPEA
ncbi:MAG: DUF3027 domain-containing protein [Acidothermus sp.]|nr:DUF3027 domain-containing protein [Acidothermus sp.]